MALNDTQQNIASTMRDLAKTILIAKPQLEAVTKMWGTEGLNTLTDADWAELSSFTGVTQAEMQAAKGSFDSLLTAIGDYDDSPVSVATKLLKISDVVPK